jgi:hypothetical protein
VHAHAAPHTQHEGIASGVGSRDQHQMMGEVNSSTPTQDNAATPQPDLIETEGSDNEGNLLPPASSHQPMTKIVRSTGLAQRPSCGALVTMFIHSSCGAIIAEKIL